MKWEEVSATMATLYERIPVKEWAEQNKMPESAVLYNIKAGIYDGMQEDELWFVLRQVNPGTEGENVGYYKKRPAGFDYAPPVPKHLPWPVVPGPFKWVSWAWIAGALMVTAPFLIDKLAPYLILGVGAGLSFISATFLYEGLRTGTIRDTRGVSHSFSSVPVGPAGYVTWCLLHAAMIAVGLSICIIHYSG